MDLDFKKNLSNPHRLLRLAVAMLLFILVYSGLLTGWWAFLALVLGVSQVIEAALSY
ncbi:MAG: YgaP-like transmembrane domain [Carboxydocellales bacterium]